MEADREGRAGIDFRLMIPDSTAGCFSGAMERCSRSALTLRLILQNGRGSSIMDVLVFRGVSGTGEQRRMVLGRSKSDFLE